jgi:hypothetical protein
MKTRAFPFLKHSRRKGVTGITFGEHFRVNGQEGGCRPLSSFGPGCERCCLSLRALIRLGDRKADRSVSNIRMAIA